MNINSLGTALRGRGTILTAAAIMAIAAIMAFSTVMTVSAQSNTPDWKLAPTGLTVLAGDQAGELDITWDANSQTTKTLADYRVTWKPDGEDFKPNDQTDWYAYPTTNQVTVTGLDAGETYQVRVRARYDDNKKSRWSDVVTGQAGVTPNSPATGQPTIAGTAEVGETLTADTSAIADDNGLTSVAFSHQWVRSANGADNDITDATASTYAVTNADIDKAIKIRVSFTDDDGYSETLTSNATTSVPVPAPVIVPPEAPQIAQASHDVLVSNTGADHDCCRPSRRLIYGQQVFTSTAVHHRRQRGRVHAVLGPNLYQRLWRLGRSQSKHLRSGLIR